MFLYLQLVYSDPIKFLWESIVNVVNFHFHAKNKPDIYMLYIYIYCSSG